MDKSTKYLSDYITHKGINLKNMSDQLDLSYDCIYNSLGKRDSKRPLRGDEFLMICNFLEIDPKDILMKLKRK